MKRASPFIFEPRQVERSGPTLIEIVQRTERKAILKALSECGGVRAKTARRLGISRSMLYRRMAALNIVVRNTPPESGTTNSTRARRRPAPAKTELVRRVSTKTTTGHG